MATVVRPGTFVQLFTKLDAEMALRARRALRDVALVVEKQAKINASSGSHAYGTPTPAIRGTGPAVISGTLRRSITHTPVVRVGLGYETRVGTGVGFTPKYGKTTSSKYGALLESGGLRNGAAYPFLLPAFRFAMGFPAQTIYREAFGSGWRMII